MSPAEAALSRVASRPRPVGEMVAKKIIAIRPADFHIAGVLQRGGFGYLKAKIKSFNESAKSQAFFVLTDLDNAPCAPALTESWLPKPQHANLIFRVAVREVEAWLLADRTAIAGFLGVKESAVPSDVESLPYPKRALIDLARRSKIARVKSALVPKGWQHGEDWSRLQCVPVAICVASLESRGGGENFEKPSTGPAASAQLQDVLNTNDRQPASKTCASVYFRRVFAWSTSSVTSTRPIVDADP